MGISDDVNLGAGPDQEGPKVRWAVEKIAAPILTGLITGTSLAVFGIVFAPRIADSVRQPTCDNPLGLVALSRRDITASGESLAPSTYPHKGLVTYDAENLIDGNSSTAWTEGVDGLGIGSTVHLALRRTYDVRLMCVVNGYGESWRLYSVNARVRRLATSTQRGHRESILLDAGTPNAPAAYQTVQVERGDTNFIDLTIDSAYAAQERNPATRGYSDTSLSEVEVWVDPH